MNYKQQIEQKAEEYALKYTKEKYSDITSTSAKAFFVSVRNDYLAGAEAMREIANMWIPVEEKPTPTNIILMKDKDGYLYVGCYVSELLLGEGFFYNERGIDIKIEAIEWKPITL